VRHPEQHAHRHFGDISRLIEAAGALTRSQKDLALRIFRVVAEAEVAGRTAVVTEVEGSAFRTGTAEFTLDRADPLGDYIEALERTVALAPVVALPGHGETIADPAGRARALVAHHAGRLTSTETALRRTDQSAYDVSFALFGSDLKPAARRFAVAETLSHLERLVVDGRAERHEDDRVVFYTSL